MSLPEWFAGGVYGLLALACLGYVLGCTARGRGPILSNAYLFASAAERAKLDMAAEYRQATVVYSGFALMFALMALHRLCHWPWAGNLAVAVVALLVLYVLVMVFRDFLKRP